MSVVQARYEIASGEFSLSPEAKFIGYAGNGIGKNNAEYCHVRNVGPLPRGMYLMLHRIENHPTDITIRLRAGEGEETFGRSGFLIHGDSAKAPGTASRGCIILNRAAREYLERSILRSGKNGILWVV